MTLGGCLKVWFFLLVVELITSLTLVSPERLRALVISELDASRAFLGAVDTDRVVSAANETYLAIAGAAESAVPSQPPGSEAEARMAGGVSRAASAIVERGRGVTYIALFRLHWMGQALLPLTLIAIAAAIDGLVVRRRRAFSFTSTSTSAYSAATYLVLSASLLPFLYLVAPVAVPSVLLPVAGLAFAGAVWTFFSHLPGAGSIMGLRR